MSNKRARPNFEIGERNLSLYNDIEPKRIIEYIMTGNAIEGDVYDYCRFKKYKLLSLLDENDELFRELNRTNDYIFNFKVDFKRDDVIFYTFLILINCSETYNIEIPLRLNTLTELKSNIEKNGNSFLESILNDNLEEFGDYFQDGFNIGFFTIWCYDKTITFNNIQYDEDGNDIISNFGINITKINKLKIISEFRQFFEFIVSL